MEVISYDVKDLRVYGKRTSCCVYCVHVKIKNIKSKAKEMISTISDKSWIRKMNVVDRVSYDARAEQTISKIVDDILKKVNTKMSEEFGEYLISHSAGSALNTIYKHKVLPLSELWKEKIIGNPGFDFHLESAANLILFGEAKFSSRSNPHKKAMVQIANFINLRKDQMELVDLKHFAGKKAISNASKNKKAYVAAFSLNGKKYNRIFNTALSSTDIDSLLLHKELYLIGIEV